MFEIKKQVLPTPEQAYNTLVGDSKENQIVEIPLNLIDEIDNQPCKIHDDKVQRIAESMSVVGQLDPVLVIPSAETKGRYILLAGRHRCRACKLRGLEKVKGVIKQEDNPDKQRLMLLATNNDRNTDYSPSELAFSFAEQMKLLKKLGSKATSAQIAEDNNTNRKTVHKYIQLTKLIKPLLYKVDKGDITVGAGYELAFLTPDQQSKVHIFLVNHAECHITKEIARLIREAPENLNEIFFAQEDGLEKAPAKTETPKAEKKIKYNCPSEGHLQETSYETLMTVAYLLYNETYSVYKYMLNHFSTPEETVNFIIERYSSNETQYSGTLTDSPFAIYENNQYKLEFMKNKLSVVISGKNGTQKVKLSYKEADTAIRQYMRKHMKKDEIIAIMRESI